MKAVFINSLKQAKMNVSLSISQRQVVIKVLEKKNREKRFIKNWRPSLLLNVAIKTLSESLQENLNLFTIFFYSPSIIYSNQTVYVENSASNKVVNSYLTSWKFAARKFHIKKGARQDDITISFYYCFGTSCYLNN